MFEIYGKDDEKANENANEEKSDPRLIDKINEEYLRICDNPEADLTDLYNMLKRYLYRVVKANLNFETQSWLKKQDVEDALQEILTFLLTDGIKKCNPELMKFSSYCYMTAKRRSISAYKDFLREKGLDVPDEMKSTNDGGANDSLMDSTALSDILKDTYHSNPERIFVNQQMRREYMELTKSALEIFMNLDTKPYKLVGSGYSMFISKKYPTNNNANDLTSPTWALEQLEDVTVKSGSKDFINELNDWAQYSQFQWGPEFDENMKKEEFGKPISRLVFGDHFDRKAFENWDNSIRNKLKKELHRKEDRIGEMIDWGKSNG